MFLYQQNPQFAELKFSNLMAEARSSDALQKWQWPYYGHGRIRTFFLNYQCTIPPAMQRASFLSL